MATASSNWVQSHQTSCSISCAALGGLRNASRAGRLWHLGSLRLSSVPHGQGAPREGSGVHGMPGFGRLIERYHERQDDAGRLTRRLQRDGLAVGLPAEQGV